MTIFLLTYILPKFTPLFKSKGTNLPKPTLLMMALSDAMLHYWYLWLARRGGGRGRLPLRPPHAKPAARSSTG